MLARIRLVEHVTSQSLCVPAFVQFCGRFLGDEPRLSALLSSFQSLFSAGLFIGAEGQRFEYDRSMNKAFMREPDSTDARCPRCGSPGEQVTAITLAAHVRPEALAQFSNFASFCPFPQCEVAYFDSFERVVTLADLNAPVYPKDPEAPICPCFGLSERDIDRDIEEGVVTRVKRVIAQAQSGEARCSTMAANGQSCVPIVQRYYMQRIGKTSG